MKITKRSAFSALAGVGILLGAAGVTAAATGSDSTPPATAVADPIADDEANEGLDDEASEGSEDGEHEGQGRGDHGDDDDGPEAAPDYTSSVQTTPEDESDEAEASDTEASESEEDAALEALARVTPDEASAAALAAQPGTVEEVELENEAGNVVYDVEIVTDAGDEIEVIVDAGNGEVLATAAD